MQHLEVSGAVRPIYGSLGVKRLKMLLALAFASIHKKQFTLIFVLSTTFQELH